MRRIKVLIVDDAVVVRRAVSRVLEEDPAIEVIGTAPDGRVALAKVRARVPDLVTLDLDMPEMDGMETLITLRREFPQVRVIMFSRLTEAGAQVTVEALALGAADYVTKPNGTTSPAEAAEFVRAELLPRIKAIASEAAPALPLPTPAPVLAPPVLAPPALSLPAPAAPRTPARVRGRVDLLCIGSSTGGPNALAEVIEPFPVDLPVPVLIVQHMPPLFTRLLAERLDRSAMRVREAAHGDVLVPGRAYVAPGNYHMALCKDGAGLRVQLSQGPPENSCRPAVDVLFRSAAECYGGRVLAVVLTGMGQDGLRGAQDIHAQGGQILVQDEATSVVWGMPGAVARAGLAERVLPLGRIGIEVLRRISEGRGARPAGGELAVTGGGA